MKIKIKLINNDNIKSILPLLMELDSNIELNTLKSRLNEMINSGYECAGIYNANELIGICGIWMFVKYYVGKHLEADDVFIKTAYQNKGIGKQLQSWLEDLAISRGCEAIELNCYVKNKSGCSFLESVGYSHLASHYQKKL